MEIARLADTTVVVLVPEAGDEIQAMKAGLMEIADVFVVNKSDRPGADMFIQNLRSMIAPASQSSKNIEIIKTIASQQEGIEELYKAVITHDSTSDEKKSASTPVYLDATHHAGLLSGAVHPAL